MALAVEAFQQAFAARCLADLVLEGFAWLSGIVNGLRSIEGIGDWAQNHNHDL